MPYTFILNVDKVHSGSFFSIPVRKDLHEREAGLDETDGLRLTLASGRILHLRPSGNAPEFRVYAEAESPEAAEDLMLRAFDLLKQRV